MCFFGPDQIQKFWKLQKSLRCFRTSLVFFIIWEDFILFYSIDVHLALIHYINGNEPVMCFNLLGLNKNILQWHRSDKRCSFFYTSSFFVTAIRIGSEHVICVWSVLFYLNIRQSRVAVSPQTTGWRRWTVLGLPPENSERKRKRGFIRSSLLFGSSSSIVEVSNGLFPELGSGGHERKDNMFAAAFTVVLFFCLPRIFHAGIFTYSLLASMLTKVVVYTVGIERLCHLNFLHVCMWLWLHCHLCRPVT